MKRALRINGIRCDTGVIERSFGGLGSIFGLLLVHLCPPANCLDVNSGLARSRFVNDVDAHLHADSLPILTPMVTMK